MENRIVRDFQNLRVFTGRLSSVNMDELVQDLSFALEDASNMARTRSTDSLPALVNHAMKRQNKKRRSTKRRSIPAGPDSEASESSIDEALKDFMENVTVRSDSDDCPRAARMPTLLHQNVISLVESDSLTENFSPLRPLRRRRKFRRMAVDVCDNDEFAIPNARTLRPKRMKSRTKSDEDSSRIDERSNENQAEELKSDEASRMDIVDSDTLTRKSDFVAGKRKRTYKQSDSGLENDNTFTEDMASQSGSALSSSETTDDEASSTQDESREADDEQSDFFHEPGPACGIPDIIPWWEQDDAKQDQVLSDPEFQHILTGTFAHLSANSQRGLKTRLSRMADTTPRYSVARYMQDRQKWREASGPMKQLRAVWANSQNTVETKRRRKTPPNSSSEGLMINPEPDFPIPDSNIGNKMLQMMGWTAGNGLGPNGTGIKVPIQASVRPRRQGLGFDMDDDS